jgi:hypothetical protein
VISQFVRIPVPETLRLLTLGSFVLSLTACTATAWLYYAGWRVGIAGLLAVDGLLLAVVSRSGSRYQRRGGGGAAGAHHRPLPLRRRSVVAGGPHDIDDEGAELL